MDNPILDKKATGAIARAVEERVTASRDNGFALPHEDFPLLDMEADFAAPRPKSLLAEKHRQFLAAIPHPYYDVELPDED